MKTLAIKTVIPFLCLSGLSVAAGVHYRFTSAGEFPGAYLTVPLANNLHQIVGYYETTSIVAGYLESISPTTASVGTFATVTPPGSGTSYASGTNAKGVVVGGFCGPSGCNPMAAEHGFTYNNGIYTTIDYPQSGATTAAYGINDLGEIVGGYCTGPYACPVGAFARTGHGFLDNQGVFTELDFPGSQDTQADAINDAGVIVGAYDINLTGPHGFIYQNGVFKNIDVPGANFSQPTAISNKGLVAGSYATSNGIGHGFLYEDGKFATVDYPHTIDTGLSGINDNGVIVGIWAALGGQFNTFRGIPIRNPVLP